MAIKNSRVGKRGSSSSSSSSYAPTVTTFLFVALCVFGVWFFTSSSSSVLPSHATTSRHSHAATFPDRLSSRLARADPPPALDDTQGDLPEDAVKGDETLQQEKAAAGSTEEEEQRIKQEQEENQVVHSEDREQRQQNAEEQEQQQQRGNEQSAAEEEREQHYLEQQRNQQNGEGEQVQRQKDERSAEEEEDRELQQQRDQQNGEEEQVRRRKEEQNAEETEDLELQQQRDQQNAEQEQEQRRKDEQNAKEEENRELQQQRDEQNGEKEQKDKKKKEHNSEEELQQNTDETNEQQEQSTDQTNDSTDDQNATTTIGEDTQQESNANQEEAFHPEIDVNVQKQIEEGDSESRTTSEAGNGDGGGSITSQSQIDHVSEGSTNEQQQQQNEEEQHQSEEESNESQQPDEVNPNGSDSIPDGSRSEVSSDKGKTWATQADQSVDENARRKEDTSLSNEGGGDGGSSESSDGIEWELCNATAGPDYIPCLDNEKAIKQLHSLKHFEHRERHCPEESPTCLVPLPDSYKRSIEWPQSRDRIWYNNVPRTKLAEVKGHQNWVKVTGEYLTFPGGGTQFIHGALHYIDFIQKSARPISWGKHTRVVLDVGCGVASFGGYLFERDVLTMSFAPKDEHEAQVQFALERGIPAISAVMGSQRLPFPSRVFDVVHCARCRVPWHANGGALLLELNRVLRPGGFFVWSATPVYQKLQEDVEIWKAMTSLTKSMCWDLYTIQKDKLNGVGNAFYRKPISNDCYNNRENQTPPMCQEDDNPNAAWYVPLQACIHPVPTVRSERGSRWPEEWPRRLQVPPYWLNSSRIGVYGKPEPNDFTTDYEHWKDVVAKSYLTGFGMDWSKVRNVMDMRAVYGGFAAALKDMKLWVMNVVNIDSPDTLPIIYERGLFGMYHDWCESFSTYPRSYDLLHADHLFSQLKNRCKILPVVVEVDRIVRPGGKLIVRDESAVVSEVESLLKSLHWEIRLTFSKNQEGMLCAEKSDWRPAEKHSDSF